MEILIGALLLILAIFILYRSRKNSSCKNCSGSCKDCKDSCNSSNIKFKK